MTPAAVYRHFEGARRSDCRGGPPRLRDFCRCDAIRLRQGPALGPGRLSRPQAALIWPSPANIPATTSRCSKAAFRSTAHRNWQRSQPRTQGAGTRRRRSQPAHPTGKAPATLDVLGPCLGPQPRRGRTFCPEFTRAPKAPSAPEDLLESGIGVYLRGLGS